MYTVCGVQHTGPFLCHAGHYEEVHGKVSGNGKEPAGKLQNLSPADPGKLPEQLRAAVKRK
jgi:hypothetical protein